MFDEMRSFVLFAEEGSIQKVARRLPLTQPAVTRQIRRFEDFLGFELLDRRQKPPILTPRGREVLARSQRILAEFAELRQLAKRAEPEGVFRLGLSNGLIGGDVADAVATAMKPFPRVSLSLKTAWSGELAAQHRKGLLDAAVILSSSPPDEEAQVIGEERLVILSAAGVFEDAESAFDHLLDYPWILSPQPCDARQLLTAIASGRGRQFRLGAEIQDPGLQAAMVRRGLGLGLAPTRVVRSQAVAGLSPLNTDLELTLQVVMLRSPHLGDLAVVGDAVAANLAALFPARTEG